MVETFEVPLAFVMTPDNYQRKTRDWNGLQRDYYAIPFGEPLHLGHYRGYSPEYVRPDLCRMIRTIFTEIGLLLTPFVLYTAFFVGNARRRGLQAAAWTTPRLTALVIVSLGLVIGSFLILAQFSGARPDAIYVPAHIENGTLVPGATR